jgi:hypothetical protein
MDALSEALNAVHMTGAIFFRMECTSPWAFDVPPLSAVASVLAPGTERLVSYHLMTEGRAAVRIGEAEISAGDVLVIPHAEGHHLVTEAESGRPGGSVLLSKMAEALFIETLRRHMERLPSEQTGWLAAARDPVVGAAIAAMHRAPGEPGPSTRWLSRPVPRARCWSSALRPSWARAPSRISPAGGSSLRHAG